MFRSASLSVSSYSLSLVTAPATEPITLAEAKEQLRIDTSDEDTYITNLIIAARELAEKFTRLSFIDTTWRIFFDQYPFLRSQNGYVGSYGSDLFYGNASAREIFLPRGEIQSVTSVKVYDDSDVSATIASSNYFVSAYNQGSQGYLSFRKNFTLPIINRVKDGLEIEYVAGFGSSASDVPQGIKQGLLEQVAFMYENRGDCDCSSMSKESVRWLGRYKVVRI